ncbi:MAG: hypothetical protein J6V33_05770 [Bacteroidales bacterium]|nr:hypothetical protein [Bacteroidales bacterium]
MLCYIALRHDNESMASPDNESTDYGLRTTDYGQQTRDNRQETTDNGQQTTSQQDN